MTQVENALDGLMKAVRSSEEFVRYQKIKEKVHNLPDLEHEINNFRAKNYRIQNSCEKQDLFEEIDRLEQEYAQFRKNPIVAEYLSAENALCRLVQQINWTLIEGLDFEVGFQKEDERGGR